MGAHGRAGARGACERRWRAERGRGCLSEHVLPRESLRRARRGAGPRGDAWDDAGELACLDVAPSEQPTRAASGGSCRFQDGLVSPGPGRERVRRARAVATFLFNTHFPRNFGTWFRGPEKTNLNNFFLSPFLKFCSVWLSIHQASCDICTVMLAPPRTPGHPRVPTAQATVPNTVPYTGPKARCCCSADGRTVSRLARALVTLPETEGTGSSAE